PESRLEPSPNVPAVMKPMRSGSLSMNHAHRYGDPASKRGTFMQTHSGTAYHRSMPQHSKISESAYPGHPQSQHKCPECPTPALQRAQSP
ncbi:hypothetical protein Tco_0301992, partial [Tanacetum coccineum]